MAKKRYGQPMEPFNLQLDREIKERLRRLAGLMGCTPAEIARVAIGGIVTRLEGATELPPITCQHPVEVKDSGGRYCGVCGKAIDRK